MKAFRTMLKIELKLSVRDMNMVVFALVMPLVITLILGFVYGGKPAFEGANYTSFELGFGAMASIGILASGVMGLPLVLSEYRDKKILKRYQCTPISSRFLLFVQLLKYAVYSVFSLVLVAIVALSFGYRMDGNVIAFLGAYVLLLLALYSIGMFVASIAPTAQTAGLICCFLYFPMLILSGATLPYEIMPNWLQIVADFMPLTQGINLLKNISLGQSIGTMIIPLIVLPVITIICTALSLKLFKWDK